MVPTLSGTRDAPCASRLPYRAEAIFHQMTATHLSSTANLAPKSPLSSITYKNPPLNAIHASRNIEPKGENMPTSPARLEANAANAQHSTGPRTPEGQARSAQNARTHGLTARDVLIAPDEREEFEELLNDYQTDVQPQGAAQQSLFELLVGAAWNLRRIRRTEVRACSDTT